MPSWWPIKQQMLPIVVPRRGLAPAASGIASAALFLNEAPYLAEWIEFHRLLGVEHFYLYDNGSTDGGAEALADYVGQGIVTLFPWRAFARRVDVHKTAYAHAFTNFGNRHRWFMLVDIDEFLFPESEASLSEALARYDDCAAVRIPRFDFGPSGHKTRPPGLVIESYMLSVPDSTRFDAMKSVVKPTTVTEAFVHRSIVDGKEAVVGRDDRTLRINHYFTKSEEEFAQKMERGWKGGKGKRKVAKKNARYQTIVEKGAPDHAIMRFADAVRSRLAKGAG
jgi:hypothetical protein